MFLITVYTRNFIIFYLSYFLFYLWLSFISTAFLKCNPYYFFLRLSFFIPISLPFQCPSHVVKVGNIACVPCIPVCFQPPHACFRPSLNLPLLFDEGPCCTSNARKFSSQRWRSFSWVNFHFNYRPAIITDEINRKKQDRRLKQGNIDKGETLWHVNQRTLWKFSSGEPKKIYLDISYIFFKIFLISFFLHNFYDYRLMLLSPFLLYISTLFFFIKQPPTFKVFRPPLFEQLWWYFKACET